jgi:multiple sugar transport system permease protein
MLDPTVSPGSFLLHHVLGAHIFAQSIAPGNLPYIFAMIAFWTGAGGWIVVMYGALNTIPPTSRKPHGSTAPGRFRSRSA